jgi:hypothetical protein
MNIYTFKHKTDKKFAAIEACTESDAWSTIKRATTLDVILVHTKRRNNLRMPSAIVYNEILPY